MKSKAYIAMPGTWEKAVLANRLRDARQKQLIKFGGAERCVVSASEPAN